MFGLVDLGGAELLFDHQELERLGVAAPRRGPTGSDVARGRERLRCSSRGSALISSTSVRTSARNASIPDRAGVARAGQVDGEAPAGTVHRRLRGADAPVVAACR